MNDKLLKEFDEFKNILQDLPTNNIKNRQRKKEILETELAKINELSSLISAEVEKREKELRSYKTGNNLNKLRQQLEACKIMQEWNPYNGPFEKMHLDYYLYQLHRYYKDDLSSLNECLRKIFESFAKVGIIITAEDFNYSPYVKEYIKAFLSTDNEKKIKETFEEIYWKFPDLITVVELNIRSIYFRYEKKIEKYYSDRLREFEKTSSTEELEKTRININSEIKKIEHTYEGALINKFLNKVLLIGDYEEAAIYKKRLKYFEEEDFDIGIIFKLHESIREYRLTVDYNFILETMKKKLREKDTYKDKKANTLKDIDKLEKEYLKLINQPTKKVLFFKPKEDEKALSRSKEIIKELVDKYIELGETSFEDTIYRKLSINSTIIEVLKCACSNYLFFVDEVKKLDDGISLKDLSDKFNVINTYVYNFNCPILSNIVLLDDKNIAELICDKYNLEKVKLNQVDLEGDGAYAVMKELSTLVNYDSISISEISIEDIYFLLELEKRNTEKKIKEQSFIFFIQYFIK